MPPLRSLCLAALLPVLLGGAAVQESPMPVSLDALRDLAAFEVTLSGSPLLEPEIGRECLFFESAYGDKRDGGWAVFWMGHATDRDVVVHTPRGTLALSTGKLRLYLAPALTRRFATAAEAPGYLGHAFDEVAGPVTWEAYCLAPGRTYHARVDAEHYYLPPERGSDRPRPQTNLVLQLSDAPFEEGRPQREGTPATTRRTY